LNPKKLVFGVDEGKLLGHIVSKEGIKIDPTRIEGIQQVPLPSSKQVVYHSLAESISSRDSYLTLLRSLSPFQKC
jgi:hypothetical protein